MSQLIVLRPHTPQVTTLTVTTEPDDDFLKYLSRKLKRSTYQSGGSRIDISLDTADGDVLAGIATFTAGAWLVVDMLWVDPTLRGRGYGRGLLIHVERLARERGCTQVRVNTTTAVTFYEQRGYRVAGQAAQFPDGALLTWLHADLCCLTGDADTHALKGLA